MPGLRHGPQKGSPSNLVEQKEIILMNRTHKRARLSLNQQGKTLKPRCGRKESHGFESVVRGSTSDKFSISESARNYIPQTRERIMGLIPHLGKWPCDTP